MPLIPVCIVVVYAQTQAHHKIIRVGTACKEYVTISTQIRLCQQIFTPWLCHGIILFLSLSSLLKEVRQPIEYTLLCIKILSVIPAYIPISVWLLPSYTQNEHCNESKNALVYMYNYCNQMHPSLRATALH